MPPDDRATVSPRLKMTENLSAPHWNYFKTICDDVEKLGRFVELVPPNYGAYSVEIVRLFFATCSEIDVVLKLLCAKINAGKTVRNIDDYCEVVTATYPNFNATPTTVGSMLEHDVVPWDNWASGKAPKWWRAYNNVKHARNAFFQEANIGNLLHALAGLCVVLCYYQQAALKEWRYVWPSEFIRLKVNGGMLMLRQSPFGGIPEPRIEDVSFGFFKTS